MNLRTTAGGLARFAHLAGMGRATAAPKAEETVPDKKEHDDLEEKVEDLEEKVEDLDDKVEDLDDDETEKTDETEEKDKPDAAAKARAAAMASGRKAERLRCAAIFGATEAGQAPVLAAHLAFETGLSAKTAIGLMRASVAGGSTKPAGKPGLSDRMAGQHQPRLGNDSPGKPTGAQGEAASIIATLALVRGSKK